MATQKLREKVLIICNHNSARSQIAEGLLKSLYGEYYEVYSAGSQPTTVNIYAIKVLEEIGVDISGNRSKSLKEFEGLVFDYVVTVCEGEGQKCPFFFGGKTYIHKSFEDPAAVNGDDCVKFDAFRRNRDEIKFWLVKTFKV
ncbi:MAG: arsenate reductase ArsC [Methanobacterium sp.]|uniref:arsenate reductase ArsC n=1 Tax=Methanobacterium sp. TaxID=2164 RepID=UPI003C70DBC1